MELVDDINICRSQGYADHAGLTELKQDAKRVLQLLNGYIRYLQDRKSMPSQDEE